MGEDEHDPFCLPGAAELDFLADVERLEAAGLVPYTIEHADETVELGGVTLGAALPAGAVLIALTDQGRRALAFWRTGV